MTNLISIPWMAIGVVSITLHWKDWWDYSDVVETCFGIGFACLFGPAMLILLLIGMIPER